MRYVTDAARNVARNPQFIAIKIASVAPTTENAPFMPHAHVTIRGALALRTRMPAGIGTPSVIPTGTSIASAMSIRMKRGDGIDQATMDVTTTIARTPIAAAD